jgi:hypothetical protein
VIWNSTIEARSWSTFAIGSASVDLWSLSGCRFVECDGNGGVNAASLMISDASLMFVTNRSSLFGVSPSSRSSFDLFIAYREVTSNQNERLSSLLGPFLHVDHLMIPEPDSPPFGFWARKGTFNGDKSFERCIERTVGRIQSVVVKAPGEGLYSFP